MYSTSSPNNQPKRRSSWRGLIFSLLLLFATFWVVANKQYIADVISYVRYTPTSDIAAMADRATMTEKGRFMFYVTHPSVDEKDAFNQECTNKETGVAILGCYSANRIYVYDVKDTRLDGIKEVTAAHEMLHAVYERLSASEKTTVNELLEYEYRKLTKNPAFEARMAFYDKTEPGERNNELHSIIGTEVADISPKLEEYYKKYFNDRGVVVKMNQRYEAVFSELEKSADDLAQRMDDLSKKIEASKVQYKTDVDALNADIQRFNERAARGDFRSQTQFNSERVALTSRVSGLENSRDAINADVVEFNQLVKQYNELATQTNNLYKSINSTLPDPPKVQ